MIDGHADAAEQRKQGIVIDLEALEEQAQTLYLHRFIAAIRKVRAEHGRYLKLRAGDELAIRAADDASGARLNEVTVDGPPPQTPEQGQKDRRG